MVLRSLGVAVAAFSLSCLGQPAHAAAEKSELTDLTQEFSAFWESSRGMPDAARVKALRARFEPLLPGFYSREKAGPFRYDDLILKALEEFPEKREGIEEVSRRFRSLMTPARATFETALGSIGEMPPIYLLHSLGEMDGGVRRGPDGSATLFFGADVIARNHLGHNIQPFFHHELFHVVHGRRFKDCEGAWCGVWGEGLAVYVAEELNPGATDSELLLVRPVPLRAAIEKNRAAAICNLLTRLDSKELDDWAALMSTGKADDPLPPRSGYYLGYLVAKDLGRARSLRELAALSPAEVRPLMEQSLRGMARCAEGERG